MSDGKNQLHQAIGLLKELAIQLGRTPTREEFTEFTGIGRHIIESRFGSWTVLLQAADLKPELGRKITSDIFKRDIAIEVENYKPREMAPVVNYTPTLVIGDTHF